MADLPVYQLPSDVQIIEIGVDRSLAPVRSMYMGAILMGEVSLKISFTSASPLDIPEPPFMLALGFTAQMFEAHKVEPLRVAPECNPDYEYEIMATGTLVAGDAAALLEAVRVLRLR